ncbi:MAG: hypothetical protein F8N37_09560 [Telmatospirillum sp.]|nr:hypothetical protein [Telmatospirillum sp.]
MAIPPPKASLTIFPSMPTETQDTFSKGVQALGTNGQQISLILFSPNLQLVASMDNSNSDATCSYQVSVSTGFTFSSTQSFSISETAGVSIEVVTVETTITYALSFTEQWNTTRTETMTFDCPAGKKAFVYQGTLMSRQLGFNTQTGKFAWTTPAATALTELLVTSRTPVGRAPSNPVRIL